MTRKKDKPDKDKLTIQANDPGRIETEVVRKGDDKKKEEEPKRR